MEPVKNESLNLRRVLNKIEIIGNTEFSGETRENIKTIYDRLTVREKRLLLQAFFDMSSIVSTQFGEGELETVPRTAVDIEVDEIDAFNAKEIVRLKIWLAKGLFTFIVTLLTVLSGILYFVDPTTTVFTDRLETAVKIWKIIAN